MLFSCAARSFWKPTVPDLLRGSVGGPVPGGGWDPGCPAWPSGHGVAGRDVAANSAGPVRSSWHAPLNTLHRACHGRSRRKRKAKGCLSLPSNGPSLSYAEESKSGEIKVISDLTQFCYVCAD